MKTDEVDGFEEGKMFSFVRQKVFDGSGCFDFGYELQDGVDVIFNVLCVVQFVF